ncbi:MAG: exo-alpha-sialidase [Verrucomicrobia bacterium]|nr:exo-alpha-sialidase [Verrucomicrobiota bacterium]
MRLKLSVPVLALATALLPRTAPAQERPERGPWNRDLYLSESADGRSFGNERVFVERGGVPTLVRDTRGRLVAAFQWFPFDQCESFDRVAVMISEDDGKTWSRTKTIHVEGLPADFMRPFDPTLAVLDDGRLRLYFTSHNRERRTPAIYSAVSADGKRYKFEPGLRFGVEGERVIDCAVGQLGKQWHLFAPVQGARGEGYHAISDDGLSFRRLENVRIDGDRQWLGCAVTIEEGLRFFGTGRGGVWSVTSRDGAKWQLEEGSRGRHMDPGVAQTKDGHWLLIGTGPLRAEAGPPPFDPRGLPVERPGQPRR